MTADERIIAAYRASKEHEKADIDWLCEQLGLPHEGAHRSALESFRKQIWNVASEHGFDAAMNLK